MHLTQIIKRPFQRLYVLIAATTLFMLFFTVRTVVIGQQEEAIRHGVQRVALVLSASINAAGWSFSAEDEFKNHLKELVDADRSIESIFVVRCTEFPSLLEVVVEERANGPSRPAGVQIDAQFYPGIAEELGLGSSVSEKSPTFGLYPIRDDNKETIGFVGVEIDPSAVESLNISLMAGFLTILIWIGLITLGFTFTHDQKAILRRWFGLQLDAPNHQDEEWMKLRRRVERLAVQSLERERVVDIAQVSLPQQRGEFKWRSALQRGSEDVVAIVVELRREKDREEVHQTQDSDDCPELMHQIERSVLESVADFGGVVAQRFNYRLVVLFIGESHQQRSINAMKSLYRIRRSMRGVLKRQRPNSSSPPLMLVAGACCGKASTPQSRAGTLPVVLVGSALSLAEDAVSLAIDARAEAAVLADVYDAAGLEETSSLESERRFCTSVNSDVVFLS